jgi:protein-L-isoaspartate(D-aspartate) O-methyltransferase
MMTVLPLVAAATTTSERVDERSRMVREQIEKRGIDDPIVLSAMRNTPRHLFVPDHLQGNAYEDRPLPIGFGQTISQPYIVALMTQAIQAASGMRILEIGTGSGYQAAVLAETGAEVFSIEIVSALAARAEADLKKAGYGDVQVRAGDGYHGWLEAAPFDAIIVTAAAEAIPPPLLQQLKDGGRLIIPVGPPLGSQYLVLVEREDGRNRTERLLPVRFVPFTRGDGR